MTHNASWLGGDCVWLALAGVLAIVLAAPLDGRAAKESRVLFDLPADSVERSLKRFSEQASCEVLFASRLTRGVRANPIKGSLFPRDAIAGLLANTGLIAVHDGETGAFSVRRETAEERAHREKPGSSAATHRMLPPKKPNP